MTVLPRLVTTPQGAGDFDVAADGTLAYVDAPGAAAAAARTLVWVDRQGAGGAAGGAPAPLLPSARVAGRDAGGGGHRGPGERHLGVGSRAPHARPPDVRSRALTLLRCGRDGRRLVFFSRRRAAGLFWQPADGTGAAERLSAGAPPSGVTPDGSRCSSAHRGTRTS